MFTPNWANGYNDESKGFVSVFLKNQGDDEVSVKCQLITDVKTMEFGFNFPLPAKLCRGYSKFLTHAACGEAYKESLSRTQTLLSRPRLKWQARL